MSSINTEEEIKEEEEENLAGVDYSEEEEEKNNHKIPQKNMNLIEHKISQPSDATKILIKTPQVYGS